MGPIMQRYILFCCYADDVQLFHLLFLTTLSFSGPQWLKAGHPLDKLPGHGWALYEHLWVR